MELVILSRYCSGRVRHWGVVKDGAVLFKSDHKASCVRVLGLLTPEDDQPTETTWDTLIEPVRVELTAAGRRKARVRRASAPCELYTRKTVN